jgi:hypothetical protein
VHADQVHFNDLVIIGGHAGVYISDAALIRFTNVAIHATTQGVGADNVNLTEAGCDGCNVVLGSNNTALVIENAFWVRGGGLGRITALYYRSSTLYQIH